MPDLSLSATVIAPLYRALTHALSRPPVACYVTPLDARGNCACKACGKPKHPRPDRRNIAPPNNYADKPIEVAVQYSDGRYGILAAANRLVFIDVDNKKGKKGQKALDKLQERLGPLPATLVQSTPNKGLHLIYRRPAGQETTDKVKIQSGAYGDGIDVLVGENDLIIAGAGYDVLAWDGEIPELPLAYWDLIPNRYGSDAQGNPDAYQGPAWSDHDLESLAWAKEEFAHDCQFDLPKGGPGQNNEVLGLVAMRARFYGLPPEVSIPIAFEHWNSRSDPPMPDMHDQAFQVRFIHQWESGRGELGGRLNYRLWQWGQELEQARQQALAEAMAAAPAPTPPRPLERAPSPSYADPEEPRRLALDVPRRTELGHQYSFRVTAGSSPKFSKMELRDLVVLFRDDPRWRNVFQWDEFGKKIYAVNPPMRLGLEQGEADATDYTALKLWCNEVMVSNPAADNVKDAFAYVAKTYQSYHPILEYLDSLDTRQFDGESAETYLDSFARDVCHVVDYYERLAIVRQLVASVARILSPGVPVHTCVVLTGPEGVGKSSLIKTLYSEPYFTDGIGGDLTNKDAHMLLWGKWGVELAELAAMHKTTREGVLSYLSRSHDKFRAPYDAEIKEHARSTVFWATTNRTQFIDGQDGDRRLEPVTIQRDIEVREVREVRDRVWAAALVLYRAGYEYWISGRIAHARSAERKLTYQVDDVFGEACSAEARRLHLAGADVTTAAVWLGLHSGDKACLAKLHNGLMQNIGRALRGAGFRPKVIKRDGECSRVYLPFGA